MTSFDYLFSSVIPKKLDFAFSVEKQRVNLKEVLSGSGTHLLKSALFAPHDGVIASSTSGYV